MARARAATSCRRSWRGYYVVESARVQGKPRIVHQTYLGSAEKVAALVKDRTAPILSSATALDFGLRALSGSPPGSPGLWDVLAALWPPPRSGPSTAHYLFLAAAHRISQPGPKTEVAEWNGHSILHSLWGFPPERRGGPGWHGDECISAPFKW